MYEFACTACSEEFEELVSMSGADKVACPSCGSTKTQKLLSKFQRVRVGAGAGAGPSAAPAAPSGGCCGGGCGCG